MPKVGMEPVRRRQIIAATKTCIHQEGIARTSASRIARQAGIAPGLITHYFDDKDELLLETFRSIYRELATDTRRRLGLAQSPAERMLALVEAQISPSTLTPESVTAWLAIYSTMRDFPLLERIERAYDHRLISNLTHELRGMGLDAAEARDIAEELSILMDGLWQNLANPVTFTIERARRLLYRYLALRLPNVTLTPPEDDAARRAAEDAGLSAEARQFLKDNLPLVPVRLAAGSIVKTRSQLAQLYRPEAKASAQAFGVRLSQTRLGDIEALRVVPRSREPEANASLPAPRLFYLFGGGYVTIGADCLIGPRCSIYTPNHAEDPTLRREGWERASAVMIGDNVWLGGSVTILPGGTIGSDSIIGAGSVVTRDIPAGVVAVGNPCRVVRPIRADV